MTGRTGRGLAWLGGVAMLVVTLVPPVLLWFAPRSAWIVHFSADSGFDLGGLLSVLPGLAAVALLAPFVGYCRDALLMIFPGANVYIAWIIGSRVAQLSRYAAPAPAADFSDTATRLIKDPARTSH
jgi:hypothetical protein